MGAASDPLDRSLHRRGRPRGHLPCACLELRGRLQSCPPRPGSRLPRRLGARSLMSLDAEIPTPARAPGAAAPKVLGLRHRLEVLDVHAERRTAEVIYHQPGFERAMRLDVDPTVRCCAAESAVPDAVPAGACRAEPESTTSHGRCDGDLGLEQLEPRSLASSTTFGANRSPLPKAVGPRTRSSSKFLVDDRQDVGNEALIRCGSHSSTEPKPRPGRPS
jgi:hypothetical protein